MSRTLKAMRRRWNALSYDLLNEEVARLDRENDELRAANEELRVRLARAEEWAESWRQDALEAMELLADENGGVVGLTKGGNLVVTA